MGRRRAMGVTHCKIVVKIALVGQATWLFGSSLFQSYEDKKAFSKIFIPLMASVCFYRELS